MVLDALSSLAIALLRKRELDALLKCDMAVCIMCLYLAVPWAGLSSMIVTFPS